jgi:hemolysin D
LSFLLFVTTLVLLVSLVLFVPDDQQIMVARRLANTPLREVIGVDVGSMIMEEILPALRPHYLIMAEKLQSALLWQAVLGLSCGLLVLLVLLRAFIGLLRRVNVATLQSESMPIPDARSQTSGLRSKRRAEELQFLPAALEIIETPPSPTGRAIGATIIALFCVALAWASISHIDIVASASGKIIPTGRTKVVQPFETGVVRSIHVRDGQRVKAGETLIELDATMNAAERDHLKSDLIASRLEIARLQAALGGSEDPLVDFHPPEEASPTLITMQGDYLVSQIAEQRAKLKALDRQRAQKEAEVATIVATISKLEVTIPLIKQRVEIRQSLNEFGTKLNYLETLQQLTEHEEDLKVQTAHLAEAKAAVAALIEARAQTAEEYRRARYAELAEAERKAAGLGEDLVKAEQRTRLQLLTAPVDGVVQQLAIHTVGGIVTPAQALLALVPDDSHLEIEAMVSNRDIGFVHTGQSAEIKVDTFNFTRYGLIHGKVLNVSSDAIPREQPQDRARDRQSGDISSEPKGQELVYAARISLDRTEMQVDERRVPLAPGMAVTIEINTGSRRLISYLLSPLAKYKQESLRER